jgi:hypothetical protein
MATILEGIFRQRCIERPTAAGLFEPCTGAPHRLCATVPRRWFARACMLIGTYAVFSVIDPAHGATTELAPACFRTDRAYTQMAEGLLWPCFESKR